MSHDEHISCDNRIAELECTVKEFREVLHKIEKEIIDSNEFEIKPSTYAEVLKVLNKWQVECNLKQNIPVVKSGN